MLREFHNVHAGYKEAIEQSILNWYGEQELGIIKSGAVRLRIGPANKYWSCRECWTSTASHSWERSEQCHQVRSSNDMGVRRPSCGVCVPDVHWHALGRRPDLRGGNSAGPLNNGTWPPFLGDLPPRPPRAASRPLAPASRRSGPGTRCSPPTRSSTARGSSTSAAWAGRTASGSAAAPR